MALGESMIETKKWAEGKPEDLALLARIIAFSAEGLCQMVQDFYDGGPYSQFLTFPPLDEWHDYYEEPDEIAEFMARFVSLSPSEYAFSLQQEMNNLTRRINNGENVTEPTGSLNEREENCRSFNESITDVSFEDCPTLSPEEFVAFYSDPMMNFYVNVSMICDAFYGEGVGELLKKARLGNYDALEKILRLDESMISEPSIAAQVYELKVEGKKTKYLKLLECLGKRPKLKLTLQKIKYVKAGHISAYSELMGRKLTEPEIRALFDAVSSDRGNGPIDTTLPESSETFSKVIQRERVVWLENNDYPDKS